MNLPSLQGVHVLVVGDVMLDRYWSGPARRVSQEAPVPVIHVQQVDDRPGGAANVALNVASLGARCTLVGVVGDDDVAATLTATLEAAGVVCDLVRVESWPTTVKLRVVSQQQQLLRTDFEAPLPDVSAQIADKVGSHLADASALILQDYDKGALLEPEGLIAAAQAAQVPVVVDPKGKPFSSYAGCDVLKPNAEEFALAVGQWASDGELVAQAEALCARYEIGALVVTRGGAGMTMVSGSGNRHVPARPVDVFDVTGAGDTAAAGLGLAAGLGWAPDVATELANLLAGLVVGKAGTAAVSGPELAIALSQSTGGGALSEEQLSAVLAQARAAGERIVFTNGCFDILHAGHVSYLQEARRLGDRLVVAVNDDASVARLKGPGRPVNPLPRRVQVLAALQAVDYVVSFAEDTPERLLRLLQPDLLVKGGDYSADAVVGADIVRDYGGEVLVLGLVEDVSTSQVLQRITDGGGDG